jgi:hypothetical protein
MDAVDHFTSADLAKIVDDLRRWVIAAGAAEAAAPKRGPDEGPGRGSEAGGGRR